MPVFRIFKQNLAEVERVSLIYYGRSGDREYLLGATREGEGHSPLYLQSGVHNIQFRAENLGFIGVSFAFNTKPN